MSVTSTLYIGQSGLRTNESAIGVIGNNIANVNTVGYKSSRAVFADVLSQTVLGSAGASQAGLGSQLAAVQRMVEQGALLGTSATTDLAINGNGLFMVSDPNSSQNLYTRNGQFQLNEEGYLTTVDGLRLQGYTADVNGNLGTRVDDLNIGEFLAPPQATSQIDIDVNLSAATTDSQGGTFSLEDPAGTSDHSTSVTVYDAHGNPHQVEIYFAVQDGDPNTWEWYAVIDGGELEGEDPGELVQIGDGTIEFAAGDPENPDDPLAGTLIAQDTDPFDVEFVGDVGEQEISFSFGDIEAGTGSTRLGDTNSTNSVSQDGYPPGALQFIDIDDEGVISGTFDNAQVLTLGQVALANFQAPHALEALGRNLYAETLGSGEPAVGAAGTGGRGDIYSGSLEQSNVDLAGQFTDLIVAQRGFQAASRTITTADEMLTEVVNLKR